MLVATKLQSFETFALLVSVAQKEDVHTLLALSDSFLSKHYKQVYHFDTHRKNIKPKGVLSSCNSLNNAKDI